MILTPEKNDNLLATLSEFAYAEYGSAIEMLAAAKNTNSPKLKIGYIHHALDEYRHTFLILKVLKNQINCGVGKFNKNYKFNPAAVIKKGYVDKERFLDLKEWIVDNNSGNNSTVIVENWIEDQQVPDVLFNIQAEIIKRSR